METYAARLLKQVLDRCHKTPFSEIRFISGMSPAYVDCVFHAIVTGDFAKA